MSRHTPQLILYVKPGCHLCDEARDALASVELYDDVQERDISRDPGLTAEFGARIPVLAERRSGETLDWPFSPADIKHLIRH